MENKNWIVAVYMAELGYGGPEEGGWWYDCGTLARIVRVFRSSARAYKFANRMNRKLEARNWGPNEGKREKSSVLSEGVYEAHVYEDFAPQGYPSVRPRYE